MSPVQTLVGCCLTLVFLTSAARSEEIRMALPGPSGPYTVEHWKRDWPGCEWQDGIKEGNLSVVERDATFRLRIDYRIGEIGPEKNGAGWRFPIGRRETAELSYTVRFGKDFDWVKGGKLPGFCGGPENVSGGRPADGTNGFSARLMWRSSRVMRPSRTPTSARRPGAPVPSITVPFRIARSSIPLSSPARKPRCSSTPSRSTRVRLAGVRQRAGS